MRLSARGQYGLRAVVELAGAYWRGPIPLREIARVQEVSPAYLEQVMLLLRRAGLVMSVRGARGGYALARPPQEITVGQVVRALEGPIAPVACASEREPASCARAEICAARRAWLRLRDGIVQALDTTTIAELLE
jgi:Rrf2 family protein